MTGTAEPESTVKIYDGATLPGTAMASAAGVWTFTFTGLANGAHYFTATATDAAGNISVASSGLTVTLDTQVRR